MKTSNIHEAKTQLSRLLDEASKGESFVIAKARKPIVKVTPLGAPTNAQVPHLCFSDFSGPRCAPGFCVSNSSLRSVSCSLFPTLGHRPESGEASRGGKVQKRLRQAKKAFPRCFAATWKCRLNSAI